MVWCWDEMVQVVDVNQSLVSFGVLPSEFHPLPVLIPCCNCACIFGDVSCPGPGLAVEVGVGP